MEFLWSASAAPPCEREVSLRRRARLFFGLAMLLLCVRAWIALDPSLAIGEAGLPLVVRQNKLAGWIAQAVFLSQRAPRYLWAGLVLEWAPMLLFGTGLWLWIRSAPDEWPALRWLRRPSPLWICLGLLAVCSAISVFCFSGVPHVQDSVAQQFQAQLFAHGRVFGSLPPHPEFFLHEFLVQDQGRWYAQYPPGQPALLALGELAGVPWLVNPLAGVLAGWLLYLAARQVYNRTTAGLALALYALSPFVWFMSGERMNHVGTLLWISLALWALAPTLAPRRSVLSPYRWLVAGLGVGLAISTRPLCGAAFGLPLVAGALWPSGRKEWESGRVEEWESGRVGEWKTILPLPHSPTPPLLHSPAPPRLRSPTLSFLALAAGVAVGVLPVLWFNQATTGSPFTFGYEIQWGSSGWGFGQSQWGPPHTLARGLGHLWMNWDAAGKYLFEWPVPSLLPLAGLLVRTRRPRLEWVLIGTLVSVSLAYVPYFFQDLCLGPRLLYAGLPALMILSARGLRAAGLAWAARQQVARRTGIRVLTQAAAVCSAAGLLANVPVLVRWYGSSYWGNGTFIVDAAREQGVHHAIVFIRDFNRGRDAALRLRGVSWRAAHGAVEKLNERWIDGQTREVDNLRLPAPQRAAELERRLTAAIEYPDSDYRRRTPPWLDYRGTSSNFNLGMCADTPSLEQQDVIYALNLDDRNELLMRDYPGRSAWIYDWDSAEEQFRLRPWRSALAMTGRARPLK